MLTTDSTTAIRMLAERYGEAWNRQDLDAIMDLHADDCVFVPHAAGSPPAEGKQAVRDAFASYLALLPDINFAPRSLRVGEDFWVLESAMTGTLGGTRVEVDCLDVIEVSDGLVASKQTYVDSDAMQDQLGSPAAAWVEMFAQGWANPVDADSFCDHFDPWLDEEVRMVQPQVAPTVGRLAFREEFARPLFDLVPDLHGTVENWAADGDTIYIELRLEGTIGKQRFELRTCDRITLRDGKAVERVAHLDAAPLVKAVLRSPGSWPKFLRTQLRSLRRSV
jgi:ketosteroid isomerase-like protein